MRPEGRTFVPGPTVVDSVMVFALLFYLGFDVPPRHLRLVDARVLCHQSSFWLLWVLACADARCYLEGGSLFHV